MFEYIESNIRQIKGKIAEAAEKCGRSSSEVTIVAVSKTFSVEAIRAAVAAGVDDIGESKLQEAEPKITALGNIARWHMIGHLQTNKAKKTAELFDMIQSLDSLHLADEVNRAAGKIGKKVECLVEVRSSWELTKHGIAPVEAPKLIKEVLRMENIRLRGMMTIGPYSDDPYLIQKAFRLTRELYSKGQDMVGDQFNILSMGMSSDYEIAIGEGSTMVRIGTAIFGRRAG
jgi:pyridoxal phosphate enzyme (YggS family)